jgi:hypothetical protein
MLRIHMYSTKHRKAEETRSPHDQPGPAHWESPVPNLGFACHRPPMGQGPVGWTSWLLFLPLTRCVLPCAEYLEKASLSKQRPMGGIDGTMTKTSSLNISDKLKGSKIKPWILFADNCNFFSAVLTSELRTLCLLGKCCTTCAMPLALFCSLWPEPHSQLSLFLFWGIIICLLQTLPPLPSPMTLGSQRVVLTESRPGHLVFEPLKLWAKWIPFFS